MASCDGCQLTLLDCEDELLAIAAAVDIVHFPEASSRLAEHGPFELCLVEGSVSTPSQLDEIRHIRAASRFLVAIGACATSGGIQALRNFADHDEFRRAVYAQPEYVDSLAQSTPISDHVKVDFELRGCPISKHQLIELVTAFLAGRRPAIRDESVCMECKRSGQVCVTVARGTPCLGPVTHAGCGALCPGYDRGCYGCYGPREQANTTSLADHARAQGMSAGELRRSFRLFTAYADAFREESERHE
ncbi:oxidoreductase [Haliangium sp.]|uniref:NADH-quinone oxidoreductase subunit B family protein n=1 Tax=Haliangium sp. TaxID=2663208 RepID=UPI003D0C4004